MDEAFPVGVPGRGRQLRPTAYGSAYGRRHPAAREALRIEAIVSMDQLVDLGPEELGELLPPDARDPGDEGWRGGGPISVKELPFRPWDCTRVRVLRCSAVNLPGRSIRLRRSG